jgi:hypothetical protein
MLIFRNFTFFSQPVPAVILKKHKNNIQSPTANTRTRSPQGCRYTHLPASGLNSPMLSMQKHDE